MLTWGLLWTDFGPTLRRPWAIFILHLTGHLVLFRAFILHLSGSSLSSTLGCLVIDFGTTLEGCGPTLGSLQPDIGPTLDRPWADFGQSLGQLWGDSGLTLWQLMADFGGTLGSLHPTLVWHLHPTCAGWKAGAVG